MAGLTFDTGALIALERRKSRMLGVLAFATARRLRITVPTPVLAEWWRTSSQRSLLAMFDTEPLSDAVAKAAGEALGAVKGSTAVDAIVMASAALRGDTVYTSDLDDLQALGSYFRSVKVLGA
jgi:predicted nucleic acid-binding protein